MLIKKQIPMPVKEIIWNLIDRWELIQNYKQDKKKFLKYSFNFSHKKTKRHYEADLIFYYHKIEKGLSLSNPRTGFGKDNVNYLLKKLEEYLFKYGWDDVSLISLNTLFEYYYFNEINNLKLDDLFKRINKLKSTISNGMQLSKGGVDEVKKAEIDKSDFDFKGFAYSRYSIRNFAPGNLSNNKVKDALEIALKTPSVCNRQPWKVHVYSDEELKKSILKNQNGNTGFGENASKILVVTSELKDFRGAIERNQSFIDGGMFSMSLIYALHSLGIGTCPLNLSITNKTEKKIKKIANINESEVLIMMIAIGNIPEKLKVASSPRRKIEEVLLFHNY